MSEDDDLNLDADALIGKIGQWNSEDAERAESAGETRADIKAFIEDTGINKKALSHLRAGLKIRKEADQLDWLRSMEAGLEIIGNHIRGQSTGDMFEDDDAVVPFEAAE